MMLAAVLSCTMTMVVFTACSSDDDDVPASAVDDKEFKADANKDTSVRPGDDFFMYCNGGYWNSTVVDESTPTKRLFMGELATEMKKREEALTIASKVKILADVDKHDAATLSAQEAKLQRALDRINAITTKEDAWKLAAQFMKEGYSSSFDMTLFSKGGKIGAMISLGGGNEFQSGLVKESLSWKLANDPALMAQVRPLVGTATRSFDNDKYPMLVTIFRELGIPLENAYTLEANPTFTSPDLAEMGNEQLLQVQEYTAEQWKQEFTELINMDALCFDDDALQVVNDENGTSMTHKEAVENFVGKYLDYAKSYEFAKAYVTADQKQLMAGFAEELRQTFRERIQNSVWMSEASKQNAIEKLNAMKFNIGCPDEWVEEGLADLSQEQTVLDDVLAMRRAYVDMKLKLIGKPNQQAAFHLTILTSGPLTAVNSFYVGNYNCMFIYPAFMLPPTYKADMNDAHNYANMMAWGHEITHGFDTDGAKWNKIGDLDAIWGNDADSQEFERRAQQLIDFYSSFDVMPFETGLKNDGAATVAENVADLGGFFLAYDSYMKHLKSQGFTGEQLRLQQKRFYEAFSYMWCGKWTAEYARNKTIGDESKGIVQDEHSLFRERVNGVVSNTDDWYDLFDVKAGDKLYLAPEKRIRIW